jgi:hypothetical protein
MYLEPGKQSQHGLWTERERESCVSLYFEQWAKKLETDLDVVFVTYVDG